MLSSLGAADVDFFTGTWLRLLGGVGFGFCGGVGDSLGGNPLAMLTGESASAGAFPSVKRPSFELLIKDCSLRMVNGKEEDAREVLR